MRNIRLMVSYDGTKYYGFQTQPGGNTIQDELQQAIYVLTNEKVKVIGSGRTDSGVHARAQTVNFTTTSKIPASNWKHALNSRLPHDIVVCDSEEVPLSFHARINAISKTYCYFINSSPSVDVFSRQYELHYPMPLDVKLMQQAATAFIGTHDFTSFCSTQSEKHCHVRTIFSLHVEKRRYHGRNQVIISVCGNGFLYNMVRIITGTLLEVGAAKRDPASIASTLAQKQRAAAGPTAPSHGLFLWDVVYPDG